MDFGLTDRQLDLMNILWDEGSATVREAREVLERAGEDLAYTSVLTVFQTLEENGKVRHEEEGKAYRYYPTVSRREAQRKAIQYVLRRLFENSPEALMVSLSDVSEIDRRKLGDLEGAAVERRADL